MPKKYNKKELVKYFFELGQMKRSPRLGFTLAGVKKPQNLAEHAFRTAEIGYIVADLEGLDPYKVCLMCLIHDNGEARIGDIHKVAARYINSKRSESKAFLDQTEKLPSHIGSLFYELFCEFEERKTKEGKLARECDWLEVALTAKEYVDLGYKGCANWIKNVEKVLTFKTTKELLEVIKKTDFNEWYLGLKKLSGGPYQ